MNKEIWAPFWTEQSVCVWEGKLEVATIVVTAKDANCSVNFRDGRDDSANIIAVIECLQNRSLQVCFNKPFHLENGLYIEIDANTLGVMVVFKPIREVIE